MVCIDQFKSTTPGFVPAHRGKPTTKQYVGATVFIDHYREFTYIYLMTELTSQSTMEAKHTFELVAKAYNVLIKRYHADNGLYDTKLSKEPVKRSCQILSLCVVNAHEQNGRAQNL